MYRSILRLTWILCGLLATTGCVRRRMLVRTDPPAALVSVDNQQIGVSPAATSFTYYGTREFRIEKDGFKTETIRQKISPPWYQLPGIDFVTETLWPFELRDERVIDVQLTPQTIPQTEAVIRRADSLRTQARAGVATPLRDYAPPPELPPVSLPPQTLPAEGLPFTPAP